jgi:hypothetical protein
MAGFMPAIHVFVRCSSARRGWHRMSGLPDFRVNMRKSGLPDFRVNMRKSGKPDLR